VPLWLIIVLAFFAALLLIGFAANVVRERRTRAAFGVRVSSIDQALAAAAAADRGWERAGLEAAARAAWDVRHPGEPLHELELVEVVDQPGTDQDHAVFRCRGEGGSGRLTLGRRNGEWVEHELREDRS
jgi:hypothetical protein